MKKISCAGLALAAGTLAAVFQDSAQAQTVINWAAPASGNWGDPARWNPATVPNNSGPNTFDARIEQVGVYTVTLDLDVRIENLRLNTVGGVLDVSGGDLTVNRNFDQTDGLLLGASNARSVRVLGATTLSNAQVHMVTTLDCAGGVNFVGGTDDICDTNIIHRSVGGWSGGNLLLNSMAGGTTGVQIAPGATFVISGDNTLTTTTGTTTFDNRGTLTKQTGAGVTQFTGATFVNTGTLNVNTGTLRTDGVVLVGNVLDGGTWNVRGGSTLDLQGVTVQTNRAKVTIDGAASTFAAMDTLTLNDTAGEFTVAGGRVFVTPAASAFNNLGRVTVGAGSRLEVPATSTLTNYNGGTGTLSGRFDVGGVLRFANTGIANLSGDLTLNGAGAQVQDSGGANVLDTVRKITTDGKLSLKGATTFTAGGNFLVEGTNSGVLDIEAGSEFVVPGAFTLDNYNAGTKTLSQGNFLVQGKLRFEHSGIETLDSKLTLDGGAAEIVDAGDTAALTPLKTVDTNGAFTLANNATFTANAPDVGGFIFTVAPTGRIAINEGSQLDINGDLANFSGGTFTDGTFDVSGTLRARNILNVTTVSSRIALGSATARITNFTNVDIFETVNLITPTGDFTVSGGRDLRMTDVGGVENRGRFTVGPGAGADFSIVDVDQDYRQVAGRTALYAGGSLRTGGDFLMTGGELLFEGGTLATGGVFSMTGGVLGGNGTLNGLTIEGGIINPGSPPPPGLGEDFAGGRLLVTGDLRMLNDSGMVMEIKGLVPGAANGYDQIDIIGLLGLGAAGQSENILTIAFDPMFRPGEGSVFVPLVFGGLEDGRWFSQVRFENLPADMMVVEMLGQTDYRFMVTSVPATPTVAAFGLGLGGLVGRRRRR